MDMKFLINDSLKIKPASKRGIFSSTTTPPGKIHMNYNENPYGMCPGARKAMLDIIDDCNRYQDFHAIKLKEVIADHYGITLDHIITGSGSSTMIDLVGEIFLNIGDEVVYCTPTYEAFPDMISDNGAVRVPVPLTVDYKFDLDAMRAAITDKTKLAIIVNPNNPTGTCVSGAQIEAFIRGLPDHVIPVVDEAYIEFTNSDETYSMLKLINEGYDRPLIVLRTFSKIYGLAGLRVGYCIAPPEIIDEMNKIDQAWNMSKLSQAAAVEAMKDQDYIKMVKEKTILNRKYLVDGLRDLGCEVADSVTNFIYFRSPIEPKELVKIMNERYDILMSAFDDRSRVTCGLPEENKAFLSAMRGIISETTAEKISA